MLRLARLVALLAAGALVGASAPALAAAPKKGSAAKKAPAKDKVGVLRAEEPAALPGGLEKAPALFDAAVRAGVAAAGFRAVSLATLADSVAAIGCSGADADCLERLSSTVGVKFLAVEHLSLDDGKLRLKVDFYVGGKIAGTLDEAFGRTDKKAIAAAVEKAAGSLSGLEVGPSVPPAPSPTESGPTGSIEGATLPAGVLDPSAGLALDGTADAGTGPGAKTRLLAGAGLGGAGLAAVVASVFTGLATRGARSDFEDSPEPMTIGDFHALESIVSRGKLTATLTKVLFTAGVALVLGGGSVALSGLLGGRKSGASKAGATEDLPDDGGAGPDPDDPLGRWSAARAAGPR